MKKLFISCPMKGRTEEAIKKSMEFMHKYAELIMGEELEVIESYIEDNPPKCDKEAIWYLGESIKKMADADLFVGAKYPDYIWRGCEIENTVARLYGLHFITFDLYKAPLFDDCKKIIEERFESERKNIVNSLA